jgi:hypothetical protein
MYILAVYLLLCNQTTLTAQSCRWSVHLMLGSREYLTRFCVWSSSCSGLSINSLHSLPRSFETKSKRNFLNVYFINYGIIKRMYIFSTAKPNRWKINFNLKNIPSLQLIRSVKKLGILSSLAKSDYHKIKRYFSNSTCNAAPSWIGVTSTIMWHLINSKCRHLQHNLQEKMGQTLEDVSISLSTAYLGK